MEASRGRPSTTSATRSRLSRAARSRSAATATRARTWVVSARRASTPPSPSVEPEGKRRLDLVAWDWGGHYVWSLDIANYNNYTVKEAGKNKTIGTFDVKAKEWDATLGGEQFDIILMEHFADKFNEKWGAAAKGDRIAFVFREGLKYGVCLGLAELVGLEAAGEADLREGERGAERRGA